MDQVIAEFIRKNINLIDNCQFDEFQEEVEIQLFTQMQVSSIYQTLYKAGIDILPDVTRVPRYFMYRADIKNIVIPSNIKVIDQEAFAGSSLESVTISDGVKIIKDYAFNECKNLKQLVYPSSITAYGEQQVLPSLTEFILPETITSKYTILNDCENLRVVRFVGDGENTDVIEDCKHLETIEFLEGTKRALKQWYRCNPGNKINIYLPHSCTWIDKSLTDTKYTPAKYKFYVYKDSNADIFLQDCPECEVEYRS